MAAYHGRVGHDSGCPGISPTPHYYTVTGRAAEIARALGSPIGGPEHLFLGMLHDGGWPVAAISGLVDLGQAETAVTALMNAPGYSPPPRPRTLVPDGHVWSRGGEVALELGDSYLGLEHAFLAMIRRRDSIPARALAGLADLGALEAAVLEAKNAPPAGPPDGAVWLPGDLEFDAPLRRALGDALPDGTTFAFNSTAGERIWLHVSGAGQAGDTALTRRVLAAALASLSRPVPDEMPAALPADGGGGAR